MSVQGLYRITLPSIDLNKITYDFEMPGGGRWHHTITIRNDNDGPVQLKNMVFESNADITNPGQLLAPYWSNVVKTKDEKRNVFIYSLAFNPTPLTLPKGKVDLLSYDIATTLGPLNGIAIPPQKVEIIPVTGTQLERIGWSDVRPDRGPGLEFQVYHANWGQYQHQRTLANEPWSALNAMTYAFIGFDESGKVFTLDSWGDQLELPELYKRRQKNPLFKATLGFGGWTNAGKRMDTVFSAMVADPAARRRFVQNAVAAVIQTGLDGIDIDYEYPAAKDAANYVLLLQELRQELTSRIGTFARLTIAAPAGSDNIACLTREQWHTINNTVDRVNVMCYDYFGAWDKHADFHAAWQLDKSEHNPHRNTQFCIADTLALLGSNGISKNKISVGMPNYARAVIVKQPGQFGGLYQEVVGAPPGEFNEAGFYSWKNIYNVLNKQPSELDSLGVKDWCFYDSDHPFCKEAGMCLLSGCLPDGRWVVMTFLDQKAATKRAQMIKSYGYGGTMLWANYCEPVAAEHTITQAIANGLNVPQKELQATNKTEKTMSASATKPEPASAAISAKEAVEKIPVRDRIITYAAKIRGFFGSNVKAGMLEAMRNADGQELSKRLNSADIGGKLKTHRNVFKRAISAILDPIWEQCFQRPFLTPPKSYRLAEELRQTKQLLENPDAPNRIITEKATPDIVIAQSSSYATMSAVSRPVAYNPASEEGRLLMGSYDKVISSPSVDQRAYPVFASCPIAFEPPTAEQISWQQRLT